MPQKCCLLHIAKKIISNYNTIGLKAIFAMQAGRHPFFKWDSIGNVEFTKLKCSGSYQVGDNFFIEPF